MRKSQEFRKPYKVKKKKSILKNGFFRFFILFLVAGAGFFYLIVFSSFSRINAIAVSGEKEMKKEDIQSLVWRESEKNVLFWKSKSVFLVNSDNIQKKLLSAFPEISQAKVIRKFPDTIDVAIEERSGAANWLIENRCFLITGEGIIFKETRPNEKLIKIRDERRISSGVLGEKIIEKDKLEKILEIGKGIEENVKIGAEEFIVFDERLNVKTVEEWEIYFDPEEDTDWQLTELSSLLDKEISPENRKNLEYVDLRFSRVFYKYKGN